jgi:ABC-type glutathione transport system ATPase component
VAEPIVTVAHAEQTYRARGAGGRAVHVHALRDVDLTVMPGETVSIVGESGSGKSTLSRLLVGLELPKSGTVQVAGHDTSMLKGAAEKDFRRSVQMVFQDASRSLDPRYTVRQLLLEALRLRDPGAGRDEALELLDLVHLPRSAFGLRPGELSGGLRQRVAIARAVAPKPRLLVADEPVSALDVTNQQRIMSLFAELVAARDLTLVMVTHDLALVRDMSDRVVTMRQGSIVEMSAAADFYAGPTHPYSRALLAAMPDPGLIGVLPAEAEREPTTTS